MVDRLLLVSNRLPVTVEEGAEGVRLQAAVGGLATGLRAPHERSRGLWFGWPGDAREPGHERPAAITDELAAQHLVPLNLSPREVDRFYHGFANGVVWPLFHYLLDRVPLDALDWDEYVKVNARYADLVARRYEPGDLIWVHDYHLALVPALVRERLPGATIGFFLHIPFPSSEVFRLLPWRAAILRGLLGADVIGFHTHAYLRHFAGALLRVLGLEVEVDQLWHDGRMIRLGVYPMGVDAAAFSALAGDPALLEEATSIRRSGGGQIILAVDRLDYTKGIPRRLLAFERLLERQPELREQVRLVQVAVPSRGEVPAYETYKRQVDELTGRINGRFGTASHAPIHSIQRSLPQRELVALYRAADVMAVTPLRDGLNLVAKEFVASRVDEGGALVLSEFAGAAAELPEALIVNPYDIEGFAAALAEALAMPDAAQAARMRPMRDRVAAYDIHRWAQSFIEDLTAASAVARASGPAHGEAVLAASIIEQESTHTGLLLMLDYDGTLQEIVGLPHLAVPGAALLELLRCLASRPRTAVHVVSGRERGSLDRWLGEVPVALHAEHGLWMRRAGEAWVRTAEVGAEWTAKVRPILDEFVKHLPGSFVEEKSAGLAWHYRRADPESGALRAKELRLHLFGVLSNLPVEVLAGHRVVEIRPHGVNKGGALARAVAAHGGDPLVVAIGDDRTDEDLFAALPPGSVGVRVGAGFSRAAHRLSGPAEVQALLRRLVAARSRPRGS